VRSRRPKCERFWTLPYLLFSSGDLGEHHVEGDHDNLMHPEAGAAGRLNRQQIEKINVSPPAFPLQTVDPFAGPIGGSPASRQTVDPFA
jgi:hypothetical protein